MRSLATVLLSRPKEVTMKARSKKLAGPWTTSADGSYAHDLVIDPELGLGVLYINNFRALSFRYYRVGATAISLFADDGFAALQGTVSVRSTDQTEEKPNG